jgi:hypothetical protein
MEARRLELGTSSIGYSMMMVERSRLGAAMGGVDGSAQTETRGAAAGCGTSQAAEWVTGTPSDQSGFLSKVEQEMVAGGAVGWIDRSAHQHSIESRILAAGCRLGKRGGLEEKIGHCRKGKHAIAYVAITTSTYGVGIFATIR